MSINTRFTDEHNHTSVQGYIAVFAALMVLTLLTVLMSQVNFGLFVDAFIAVAIATVKTSLVIYFFMHVRESPKIIALIAVGSFAWLSILFLFTITDFLAQYGEGASSLPHGIAW
jgi:cytochrome c oxidase subunit 4